MKLDRNTNEDGRGKYALVNMRKLIPLMAKQDACIDKSTGVIIGPLPTCDENQDLVAFEHLVRRGIISLGNESPGDQFFVVKYKDRFTPHALRAYAYAASVEARVLKAAGHHDAALELHEFAGEMNREAQTAETISYRLPD